MKELLYLKDEQLKGFIEKIFISYRESFNDSKKILKKYKIGIAHHKALHLISFYNGITISQLLKKLDYVDFKRGSKDTRVKHIFLNDKGNKIFEEIFFIQKKRIYNAFMNSSSKEVINFDIVLKRIINEKI